MLYGMLQMYNLKNVDLSLINLLSQFLASIPKFKSQNGINIFFDS